MECESEVWRYDSLTVWESGSMSSRTEASAGRGLHGELAGLRGPLHVRPQLVGRDLRFSDHTDLRIWSLALDVCVCVCVRGG